MCTLIHTKNREIETVKDLIGFLGSDFFSISPGYELVKESACLCQVDVPSTLKAHKIPYQEHDGDFYIEEAP